MGMTTKRLTESQRLKLRKKCLKSLFCFCKLVMGYDEISEGIHGDFCYFLEGDANRKQVTMPRSFVKTWISSIAYPIWVTLPRGEEDEFPDNANMNDKFWKLGPNMRILVASYVISNAEKMIGLIRKTYEGNQTMQIFFPEVIPHNFNKVKWSNQAACIRRDTDYTECTFEAAGIGGASVSRHYDMIIEDDLIYAKKDDFTDKELQPNKEDIEKAIGWHKLATSLLVPGKHTRIHNTGTRWAPEDLVDYIWKNEPSYVKFVKACVNLNEMDEKGDWRECSPTWPECYDHKQLQVIADAQGPYMFATQYLLHPSAPEEHVLQEEWLEYYDRDEEISREARYFTTVDLSGWENPKRKTDCRTVILTCAWDGNHHMWIVGYTVARMNPTQVLYGMANHWNRYSPESIGIEDVYYQASVAHFAREYMNEGKIPRMKVIALKPKGREKELRIRKFEPQASSGALHCKRSHKEFINEYIGYIPNSRLCKKDILDAGAYQFDIAKPGTIKHPKRRPGEGFNGIFEVDCDKLVNSLINKKKVSDPFNCGGDVALRVEEDIDSLVDPFFTDINL